MPTVRVNIFEGVGPQIPRTFDVTGDTYQDVVSTLMHAGQYSGQIYGLKGEIIDYDAGITLPEVNYIIPDGPAMPGFVFEIGDSVYVIDKLKQDSTVRDLYNNLLDQGLPVGLTIVGDGHPLLMEDHFNPHNYQQISILHPTLTPTIAPAPAVPTPVVTTPATVPTPFPTVPIPTPTVQVPTPFPTVPISTPTVQVPTPFPTVPIPTPFPKVPTPTVPTPTPTVPTPFPTVPIPTPFPTVPTPTVTTPATVPTPTVPPPLPTIPNPTPPTPVPTGVTIEIITADRGPISVIVNYGVTTAGMLVQAILPDGFAHPTNHGFRLAIIRPGEFIPQIIEHTQIVPQLVNNQQFYLVPDYETLFNGYAAFVTADVYPDGG